MNSGNERGWVRNGPRNPYVGVCFQYAIPLLTIVCLSGFHKQHVDRLQENADMKNVFSSPFLALVAFVWLGSICCSSARSPIVISKFLHASDCATVIATSSVRLRLCAADVAEWK